MAITIAYTRYSASYPMPVREQSERLSAYAADHGLTITQTLSDAAPPASKSIRRPGFEALYRMIEKEKANAVMVVSLNLLARSIPELIAVLHKAAERGIRVIALDEGLDMGAKLSMPITALLTALNGYQRFQRNELAATGREAARAAGVKFGRPSLSEAKLAKAREALAAGVGIRPAARIAGISPASALQLHRQMTETTAAT